MVIIFVNNLNMLLQLFILSKGVALVLIVHDNYKHPGKVSIWIIAVVFILDNQSEHCCRFTSFKVRTKALLLISSFNVIYNTWNIYRH